MKCHFQSPPPPPVRWRKPATQLDSFRSPVRAEPGSASLSAVMRTPSCGRPVTHHTTPEAETANGALEPFSRTRLKQEADNGKQMSLASASGQNNVIPKCGIDESPTPLMSGGVPLHIMRNSSHTGQVAATIGTESAHTIPVTEKLHPRDTSS